MVRATTGCVYYRPILVTEMFEYTRYI